MLPNKCVHNDKTLLNKISVTNRSIAGTLCVTAESPKTDCMNTLKSIEIYYYCTTNTVPSSYIQHLEYLFLKTEKYC